MKKSERTLEQKKIKRIQKEIDETKKIMEKNIDQVIVRGQKIETLVDKSKEMKKRSQHFAKQGRQLKDQERFFNYALTAAIVGALLGVIVGLYAALPWPMILLCMASGVTGGYLLVQLASVVHQKVSNLSWRRFIFPYSYSEVLSDDNQIVGKHHHDIKASFLPGYQRTLQAITYSPTVDKKTVSQIIDKCKKKLVI